MENSVDASTWALSSQDEKGHMGIFIIKPNEANAKLTVVSGSAADSVGENAAKTNDTTKQRLPSIAHTYISTSASALRSYLLCNFRRERALTVMSSKQKTTIKKEFAHRRPKPEHRIINKRLPSKEELCLVEEVMEVISTADDQTAARMKGRYWLS